MLPFAGFSPSQALLAAAPAAGPSWIASLGLWAAIIAIFYFIVFAPMRKQRKELQKTIDELKKGDRVITTGGIYGEIASVEPTSVQLKIADNVRIRLTKSAIAGRQSDGE